MKKNETSNKFIRLSFPIPAEMLVVVHCEGAIRGKFSKFIVVQCLYSAVITNVCNEKKIGNFIAGVFGEEIWGTNFNTEEYK